MKRGPWGGVVEWGAGSFKGEASQSGEVHARSRGSRFQSGEHGVWENMPFQEREKHCPFHPGPTTLPPELVKTSSPFLTLTPFLAERHRHSSSLYRVMWLTFLENHFDVTPHLTNLILFLSSSWFLPKMGEKTTKPCLKSSFGMNWGFQYFGCISKHSNFTAIFRF